MTSVRITWWGHASATVEFGGVRLLTDPALTRHLAHLTRQGSPPPPVEARRTDVVLVSHLHADHLHLPSLRLVRPGRLVGPTGVAALTDRAAGEVDELDVGDSVEIGDVRITAVPAAHDGRRLPGSRHRGPALGYVLEHDGTLVWFAGDTGLFDGLADIGPVDVAIVPVGGWGPTLGPEHLDPVQAADAVIRVGARHAVPIHFGTFWPTGLRPLAPQLFRRMFSEPGEQFVRAAGTRFAAHLLAPGQSVEIGGPDE